MLHPTAFAFSYIIILLYIILKGKKAFLKFVLIKALVIISLTS